MGIRQKLIGAFSRQQEYDGRFSTGPEGHNHDGVNSRLISKSLIWTPGYTGFSVNPTVLLSTYILIDNLAIVWYITNAFGTSNGTGFTITGLPVAPLLNGGIQSYVGQFIQDNGLYLVTGRLDLVDGSTTATLYTTFPGGAWTAINGKGIVNFTLIYPFARIP